MELIIAIKNNDHEAFHVLYNLWHKRAYYFFLKRSGSEEAAKELTQLTFIKIWKYRESLSTEHSFEAQLFQTAKIIWIDEIRRKARSADFNYQIDENLIAVLPAHQRHDTDYNNQDHIKLVLAKLPPVRRKVFILNKVQGYSYKEISAQLSISIKTVDNHLSQALKQLRTYHLIVLIYSFIFVR